MSSKRQALFPWLIGISVFFFLSLLIVHMAVGWVLAYQLEDKLHPEPGQGTYVGEVHSNLFTGTVSVDGIRLERENSPYFELQNLSLDIDMGALLQGKVVVTFVDLGSGSWQVTRLENGEFDLGFDLPASSDNEESGESSTGLPIELQSLVLRRFNVVYHDQLYKEVSPIRLERFELKNVHLPVATERANAELALLWGNASADVNADFVPASDPDLKAKVQLKRLPIHHLIGLARQNHDVQAGLDMQSDLEFSKGQLSLHGKMSVESVKVAQEALKLTLDRLALGVLRVDVDTAKEALEGAVLVSQVKAFGLGVDTPDVTTKLASVELNGDINADLKSQSVVLQDVAIRLAELVASQGDKLKAQVAGTNIQGLSVSYPQSDVSVLNTSLEGVQVAHESLVGEGVKISEVNINELASSGNNHSFKQFKLDDFEWQGYPLKLAQLDVSKTRSNENGVEIGAVRLSGLDTRLERKKKGDWLLPVKAADGESKPSDKATQHFSVQSVNLLGNNTILISDAQAKPELKQKVIVKEVSLGALNSRKSGKDTPLKAHLIAGDNIDFELDAVVRPLGEQLYIDAKGELSNFPLTQVNSFATENLGHRFHDGYIDDYYTLKIEKRQLDMTNKLELLGLDVEALEGKEGPPIGLAVSLLEDRDGRIEIDVPAKGSLDNPDFTVSGALTPVITKAIAGAGLLSIQPLGSVVLLGNLIANEALKVTFEPAEFAPQGLKLKNKKEMQALAKKLVEKPKLKVRLCGRAVEADRSKKKKSKLSTDDQLLVLAKKRESVLRKLMQSNGVAKKQLRNCRTQIDQAKDAKPRVEIKL